MGVDSRLLSAPGMTKGIGKNMDKKQVVKRLLLSRKGQNAVEYVLITAALFSAFLGFYAFYSNLVPQQFDKGARIILSVYDTSRE